MAQCGSGSSRECIAPATETLVGAPARDGVEEPAPFYCLLEIITLIDLLDLPESHYYFTQGFFGRVVRIKCCSYSTDTRAGVIILIIGQTWWWKHLMDSALQLWSVLLDLRKYCLLRGMTPAVHVLLLDKPFGGRTDESLGILHASDRCHWWPVPMPWYGLGDRYFFMEDFGARKGLSWDIFSKRCSADVQQCG